jgi:putative membrane protein
MTGAALTPLADALVGQMGDGEWGHMDWNGGWWIVMALGMVLVWALVIVGIVWLVRELAGNPGNRQGSDRLPDALVTLDHRLAAGEISPEEYRERRAMLGGSDGGAS